MQAELLCQKQVVSLYNAAVTNVHGHAHVGHACSMNGVWMHLCSAQSNQCSQHVLLLGEKMHLLFVCHVKHMMVDPSSFVPVPFCTSVCSGFILVWLCMCGLMHC